MGATAPIIVAVVLDVKVVVEVAVSVIVDVSRKNRVVAASTGVKVLIEVDVDMLVAEIVGVDAVMILVLFAVFVIVAVETISTRPAHVTAVGWAVGVHTSLPLTIRRRLIVDAAALSSIAGIASASRFAANGTEDLTGIKPVEAAIVEVGVLVMVVVPISVVLSDWVKVVVVVL